MKRAAHVAGLMEIRGNGKCILELRQITPSTVSESSGAASSNEMPVPDSAKLLGDIQSGVVPVHSTKMGVTKKDIQHYINFLQRDAGILRGANAAWNNALQQRLYTWLLKEKKGSKTKAIKDKTA